MIDANSPRDMKGKCSLIGIALVHTVIIDHTTEYLNIQLKGEV